MLSWSIPMFYTKKKKKDIQICPCLFIYTQIHIYNVIHNNIPSVSTCIHAYPCVSIYLKYISTAILHCYPIQYPIQYLFVFPLLSIGPGILGCIPKYIQNYNLAYPQTTSRIWRLRRTIWIARIKFMDRIDEHRYTSWIWMDEHG